MNGLLVLLFCKEVLSVMVDGNNSSTSQKISTLDYTQSAAHVSATTRGMMATQSPTAVSQFTSSLAGAETTTTMPVVMFYYTKCLPLLFMTGGLIIACFILLLSTLFLTCKVCQLSRRLKKLSSNCECLLEGAKNKSKSETEANETVILLEDVGNGPTKEGGKENEDGQMGEENKKKVGDTDKSEEASPGENETKTPVTAEEHSSSSKPQEDIIAPHEAGATCTSEGKEEPKDVA